MPRAKVVIRRRPGRADSRDRAGATPRALHTSRRRSDFADPSKGERHHFAHDEHYRRLGFAAEVRALGLPEDYPQDITYFTRYTRHELARLRGRSRREALDAREGADSRWPTPEPLHRVQQMYVEAVLKQQAEKWPSADVRFGWRARKLDARADGISVEAEQLETGKVERIDPTTQSAATGRGVSCAKRSACITRVNRARSATLWAGRC